MKHPERKTGLPFSALAMLVLAHPALAERGGERPTLDSDGDGYITPEEFSLSKLSERVEFSALDADGDNLLTKDEIRSYMREKHGDRRGRRSEN